MKYISLAKDLDDLVSSLEEKNLSVISIDTEFVRVDTYWPIVSLIQIGTFEDIWLIDAMVLTKEELSPLSNLLSNPKITKILHSARQDFEIFYQLFGSLPTSLFDTQRAAHLAGYMEEISYQKLIQMCLGKNIDKSLQFTNWGMRPLSDEQIKYAALDVSLLLEVYTCLFDKLHESGLLHILETYQRDLLNEKIYIPSPNEAWKRLKIQKEWQRGHLTRDVLWRAIQIARWREEQAILTNRPRFHVMSDEKLWHLAYHPKKAESMPALEESLSIPLPDHFYIQDYLPVKLNAHEQTIHQALISEVMSYASDLKVPQRAIFTKQELLQISISQTFACEDWRGVVFKDTFQRIFEKSTSL